jgi:hypothetical protein
MLRRLKRGVKSVRGDGTYDSGKFREKVHQKGGKCVIPPSRDAAYKYAEDGWEKERGESLEAIVGLGAGDRGRKLWKILSGYHRRSLVETMMYRIKKIFGPQLKARSLGAQKSESICRALIINMMNKLGMLKGAWVRVKN